MAARVFHSVFPAYMEGAMHIPKDIRIPIIVLSLEAALLAGAALIFLVLVPR